MRVRSLLAGPIGVLAWIIAVGAMAGDAPTPPPPPKQPIEHDVQVGFQFRQGKQEGTHKPANWVPIRITSINNTGERGQPAGRTVEGQFIVSDYRAYPRNSEDAILLTWEYRHSLVLPPGGRRRTWMRIYPQGHANQLDIQGDRSPSQPLYQRPVQEQRTLLVVTDAGTEDLQRTFYSFLRLPTRSRDQGIGGVARPDLEGIWPDLIQPGELPEYWVDLMSCDAVLIDGPPRGEVSEQQVRALRQYVEAGGHLIVMGGGDPARLDNYGLRDLLQFQVQDKVQRVADIQALQVFGRPVADADNPLFLPVLDVPEPRFIRLGSAQLPIVLQHRHGLGVITYAALHLQDQGLADWNGRAPMVEYLFSERDPFALTRSGGGDPGPLREAVSHELNESSIIQTVPRAWVGNFLAIYLLIVLPVNFIFWRRLGHPAAAWVSVPLLAFAFAGVTYVSGVVGKRGQLSVNQVSIVVAGPEARDGRSLTMMSLFSPDTDHYDMEVTNVPAFITHLEPPRSSLQRLGRGSFMGQPTRELILVQDGNRMVVQDFLVRSRSMSLLEAEAMVPVSTVPGTACRAVLESPDTVRWQIQNPTEDELLGCIVSWRGRHAYLGRLKPGESLDAAAAAAIDDPSKWFPNVPQPAGKTEDVKDDWPKVAPESVKDLIQDVERPLLQKYLSTMAHEVQQHLIRSVLRPHTDKPILLAWRRASMLELEVDGNAVPSTGLTLHVFHGRTVRTTTPEQPGKLTATAEAGQDGPAGPRFGGRQFGNQLPSSARELSGGGMGGEIALAASPRTPSGDVLVKRLTITPLTVSLELQRQVPPDLWQGKKVQFTVEIRDRISGDRQTLVSPQRFTLEKDQQTFELAGAVLEEATMRYVDPRNGTVRLYVTGELPDTPLSVSFTMQVEEPPTVEMELLQ